MHMYTINIGACIGVIGIQDICHFTSRDKGYYLFYFQGYRILCSISGILCFLLKNNKNTENVFLISERFFDLTTFLF